MCDNDLHMIYRWCSSCFRTLNKDGKKLAGYTTFTVTVAGNKDFIRMCDACNIPSDDLQ